MPGLKPLLDDDCAGGLGGVSSSSLFGGLNGQWFSLELTPEVSADWWRGYLYYPPLYDTIFDLDPQVASRQGLSKRRSPLLGNGLAHWLAQELLAGRALRESIYKVDKGGLVEGGLVPNGLGPQTESPYFTQHPSQLSGKGAAWGGLS